VGLTAASVGGPALALDTPLGAWVAIYSYSFLAVLPLACHPPPNRQFTGVRLASANTTHLM
jgi:hypothetical protein